MSAPHNKADTLFQQRMLASAGFYKGALDGLWGPKTEAAAQAAQASYLALQQALGPLDTRSEKNIATLLPAMQRKARNIMAAAYSWSGRRSFSFSILSGTRTYPEQAALYAKGRTSPGPKVTNANAGSSNHNFGIAIDIGIFDMKGKYLTGANRAEEQAYADLAAAVKASVTTIEWGGDWKSFPDAPHYQYRTGLTTSQTRAKFEAGALKL